LPRAASAPPVLRHLAAMSESFEHESGAISYVRIYAIPSLKDVGTSSLDFMRAAESGTEGIACIDDVARAALLACQIYEQQHVSSALRWARLWLNFVLYMQESDGHFINFILDRLGRKNRQGRTSFRGGQWWSSRALWALAAAWRLTGDRRYREAFDRGRLARTSALKVTAMQALALMEIYCAEPSTGLERRIRARCDRILAAGPEHFVDHAGSPAIQPWGYHQLQAVARAGRLFSCVDYLAACERTVRHVVTPLIEANFHAQEPWAHAPRCAYDISSLVLGLEELYVSTHRDMYREQALACAGWLYGRNDAGAALYDPATGRCADGLEESGASRNCGAESAIEGGFVELARRRLQAT
jgi:hypothetical protein